MRADLSSHPESPMGASGQCAESAPLDVARSVRALREAQPAWEALGTAGRALWMARLRDWLLDNEERLTQIVQAETGKPWQEAAMEVPVSVDVLRYYSSRAGEFLAEEHPRPHGVLTATKRLTIVRRPYEVVGVITPWNFPLAMPMMDVIPALVAGAAVALKPSEVTPRSAVELARGWREIGAPPAFACLPGTGETGAALVEEVDYVQFTGSTATGRRIGRRAGERLIPFSLELGGKDPMLVLADADLDRAVNGAAWGGLFNAGQACVSVERVYVEAPVYDEFVARLVDRVRELRQGSDSARYCADIGRMATEAQLAIVERHVQDALARGARAATGGRRVDDELSFEPTVLVDVDHSMACMREETFGPTIPVMRVADVDEAVRLANDSPYGLSASVWTQDRAKGEQIARRLDAGAVNLNGSFSNLFCFPLPQSGWKQSGVGARLGGAHGVRKYCRTQAITSDRVQPKAELFWYPYTRRKGRLTARLTRCVLAGDVRRRLGLRPR